MDLQGYLRTLRKSWWIILIAGALGLGAGEAFNLKATPMYQSSLSFYVSTPSDSAGGNAYQANQFAMAKIESYVKLLKSDALADRVIATTGLPLTTANVAGKITASSDLNTVIIDVSVVDSDPARAEQISQAVAADFGSLVDELDNRTSKDGVTGSTVKLNVVSGPNANPNPVSPKINTNRAVGLGGGLILGFLLALLRGFLDQTMRTPEAMRATTGMPTIGSIGMDSAARKYPVLSGEQLRSVRGESFRQLRTNLQFMDVDNPVRVLAVTSSMPSEGKSSIAANLGVVSAESGMRVLVIEADMRRPKVSEYMGLEPSVGLSNVLAGQVDVDDVLQHWGSDDVTVLPSGSVPPNPSELLGSARMVELLDRLRPQFDLIIIDTPPLLPVTDAAIVATQVDGVLVVVRHGKTTSTQITNSLRALEAVDARVLGCVMSMMPRKGTESGGYGYYDSPVAVTAAISRDAHIVGTDDRPGPSGGGDADDRPDRARHREHDDTRVGR